MINTCESNKPVVPRGGFTTMGGVVVVVFFLRNTDTNPPREAIGPLPQH